MAYVYELTYYIFKCDNINMVFIDLDLSKKSEFILKCSIYWTLCVKPVCRGCLPHHPQIKIKVGIIMVSNRLKIIIYALKYTNGILLPLLNKRYCRILILYNTTNVYRTYSRIGT